MAPSEFPFSEANYPMHSNIPLLFANAVWFVYLVALIQICICVLLGILIFKDAQQLMADGRSLFLSKPWLWLVVTIVTGGYIAAIVYWVMHYSVLKGDVAKPNTAN